MDRLCPVPAELHCVHDDDHCAIHARSMAHQGTVGLHTRRVLGAELGMVQCDWPLDRRCCAQHGLCGSIANRIQDQPAQGTTVAPVSGNRLDWNNSAVLVHLVEAQHV